MPQRRFKNIEIKKEKQFLFILRISAKSKTKENGEYFGFVVDASGSMGANQRMIETKGAVLSLLKDAYIKKR